MGRTSAYVRIVIEWHRMRSSSRGLLVLVGSGGARRWLGGIPSVPSSELSPAAVAATFDAMVNGSSPMALQLQRQMLPLRPPVAAMAPQPVA